VPAVCLHDKGIIERTLRRTAYLSLYGLGDLDEFFWPHTTWYGWQSGDSVEVIALLYSGLELPCLLALCDEADAGAMRSLLSAMVKLLPPRFYCHLSKPAEPALAEHYRLDSHGTHLKMGLLEVSRLHAAGTSEVLLLTDADADEMIRLYEESYPGHWFERHMLETGQYVGLRVDRRLVAIAGVHVHSPRYRVAALGNITTHPDHRNRGYASLLTAALCRRLRETCDHIGLNVKADNMPAIRCYKKLGFRAVAEYEEFMAEVPPSRRAEAAH
jgi:ribosomal protein S18 acetylase RimI-like enzyme